MLVNERGRIIGISEAFRIGIAIKIRLDEADKSALNSHRDSVSSQSQQGDDNKKQIDNGQKAEWNNVPELDSAQWTSSGFLLLAFRFHHSGQHEAQRTFLP